MKKFGLIALALLVVVMFSGVAFAGVSTSCNPCKPVCGKSCDVCKPCPKPCGPCNTCGTSCYTCTRPCAPCYPCQPRVMQYKRDVLGNKVPVYTDPAGDALNDVATGYESTLVSGQ